MTPARVGGGLLVLGLAALPFTSGPATLTVGPTPVFISAAAVVAFGVGAAMISIGRPIPLDGALVRSGMTLLALAAVAVAVSAVAGNGYDSDPLESWAIIGPLIVALIAGLVGLVSIAIGLVRLTGISRALGAVMLLGLVLSIPFGIAFGTAGQVLAGGMIVVALLGVGILATGLLRRD